MVGERAGASVQLLYKWVLLNQKIFKQEEEIVEMRQSGATARFGQRRADGQARAIYFPLGYFVGRIEWRSGSVCGFHWLAGYQEEINSTERERLSQATWTAEAGTSYSETTREGEEYAPSVLSVEAGS